MTAIYRTENQLIHMKPDQLILHYRDLIHAFGVGNEVVQRMWRDWYYVSNNYHEIVNEKLQSVPWLQNNKNGVIEFVAYVVVGCGMGGTAGKVFSKAVTAPIADKKKKEIVTEICIGVGGIGGGVFGAYKFTEKVENLPQFKEWRAQNLQLSIVEFINQKYIEDEFIEKFVCPITDRIIDEPVKCFDSFYEYAELLKSKNRETGMIRDPKRNGEIHESELKVKLYPKFLIVKRIEWCVKEDLKKYSGDKKYTESLQKVLQYVKEKASSVYEAKRREVDAILQYNPNDLNVDKKEVRKRFQEAQNAFFDTFGLNADEDIDWESIMDARF